MLPFICKSDDNNLDFAFFGLIICWKSFNHKASLATSLQTEPHLLLFSA